MRGLHPALCGWLSQAVAVLDALVQVSAMLIGRCERGPGAGPSEREVLAAAGWVWTQHRQELASRVNEVLGALDSPAEGVVSWADHAMAQQGPGGLAALTGACEGLVAVWREAMGVVDGHTRLLLRLQLAQLDGVVLPGLLEACARAGVAPQPAPALVGHLTGQLPASQAHPEGFLGGADFSSD